MADIAELVELTKSLQPNAAPQNSSSNGIVIAGSSAVAVAVGIATGGAIGLAFGMTGAIILIKKFCDYLDGQNIVRVAASPEDLDDLSEKLTQIQTYLNGIEETLQASKEQAAVA